MKSDSTNQWIKNRLFMNGAEIVSALFVKRQNAVPFSQHRFAKSKNKTYKSKHFQKEKIGKKALRIEAKEEFLKIQKSNP